MSIDAEDLKLVTTRLDKIIELLEEIKISQQMPFGVAPKPNCGHCTCHPDLHCTCGNRYKTRY